MQWVQGQATNDCQTRSAGTEKVVQPQGVKNFHSFISKELKEILIYIYIKNLKDSCSHFKILKVRLKASCSIDEDT